MQESLPMNQQNPLSECPDNFLPPFIGAHLRKATLREGKVIGAPQYTHFEASESLSTITVDHHHSQVFDMVIDSRERDEGLVSKLDDLWTQQLQGALFSRLEYAKEAAFIVAGPSKSGKSSLLFGDEVGIDSPRAGVIPRFIRAVFEEGVKGDIPSAVEVSILHVEDEDIYDLLNPLPMDHVISHESKKLLKLRWSKTCGTYVEHVSRSLASSAAEFMQLIHEAMAMRALRYLNAGRNVDGHAAHLVISVSMLATSPNKTIVFPRSSMTFVELGDVLSSHSHASEHHPADRLSHLTTRGERSRVELMKLVDKIARLNEDEEVEFDPSQHLTSEMFQKSALTCKCALVLLFF
jgi:hypothetical protein